MGFLCQSVHRSFSLDCIAFKVVIITIPTSTEIKNTFILYPKNNNDILGVSE